MTTQEFKAAFKLANSGQDLSNIEMDHLFGFGLRDFRPVTTTIGAVARVLRWQGMQFNGQWDMTAVNEVREVGRYKFIIVGVV